MPFRLRLQSFAVVGVVVLLPLFVFAIVSFDVVDVVVLVIMVVVAWLA